MTTKQMNHLINNKHTRTAVDCVERALEFSNTFMSPMFFHTTHNSTDRVLLIRVLLETLRDIYPKITIQRVGNDSVVIKKN